MKKILLIIVLVLGIGVAYLIARPPAFFKQFAGAGSGKLEQWIGQCIVGVMGSYLTPTIEMGTLDYQAPYTVIIDDLVLTTRGVKQLEVNRLTMELAEIPKIGQPIQIKRIELDAPTMRFVADTDNEAGGFVGWTDLVKTDAVKDPSTVEEGSRLSDVLVMRHVAIDDGGFIYDLNDGSEPMTLRGLELALDTEPMSTEEGGSGEAGWYSIDTTITQASLLDMGVKGRINLDTMLMDLADLTVAGQLGEANYEALPPQIQSMVREYEVRGQLNLSASGSLTLTSPMESTLQANFGLTDAFFSMADKVFPLDSFETTANLSGSQLNADYRAALLGGTVDGKADLGLSDPTTMPLKLTWQASNLLIENTLKVLEEGKVPKYAGRIASQGTVTARAAALSESLSGSGTMNLDNGRLVIIPVIAQLSDVLNPGGLGKTPEDRQKALSDKLDVTFTIRPDRIHLDSLDLTSAVVAARGDGDIFFDTRLALALNAGPMEKVQKGLGDVGKLIGKVTDSLVKYYVSGTTGEPKVSLKPLGMGIKDN
ncbi:MAG: hypothetical protein D8M59_06725 [Planctomycetes bacterium]|nr:hypothetical protein [Planctomycetota bacterium]NOG55191.1 hypothetical protein [Planctomycetota bacterium]